MVRSLLARRIPGNNRLNAVDSLLPKCNRKTVEEVSEYAQQIKALSDDRKESYRQIVEMSTEPQSVDLAKPESRYEATKESENDKEITFPTWKNHLLADKDGKYPAELNEWERTVVEAESKRTGFRFWYRNPQQPGQSSLGIAYLGMSCITLAGRW